MAKPRYDRKSVRCRSPDLPPGRIFMKLILVRPLPRHGAEASPRMSILFSGSLVHRQLTRARYSDIARIRSPTVVSRRNRDRRQTQEKIAIFKFASRNRARMRDRTQGGGGVRVAFEESLHRANTCPQQLLGNKCRDPIPQVRGDLRSFTPHEYSFQIRIGPLTEGAIFR